ncbi:MAG: hypothetical protein JWN40_1659 [Phycisphaerales bacterium]|nr:hypothetical protein [Phycisphaerales bacterium]
MYQTRRNQPAGAGIECRMTKIPHAAALLSVSVRTLQRMIAMGRTPRPIVVGTRGVRFNSEELDSWIEAGAPQREVWEEIWAGRQALRFRCNCGRKWSPGTLWRCVARFLDGMDRDDNDNAGDDQDSRAVGA